MEKKTNEDVVDIMKLILDMWRMWKRLWWSTLLLILVCATLLCGYSYLQYEPSYEAYTSFTVKVVSRSTADETDTVYNYYYDQEATKQLDKTFSYVVNSDALKDEVKALLKTNQIAGRISAESVESTNLFILHVYSATPEQAKTILEAVVTVYPEVVGFVLGGEVELDVIEAPIALSKPYNQPDYMKMALMGVLAGMVLSGIVLFLCVMLRKKVKQPEDIKELISVPCLGILPKVSSKELKKNPNALLTNHKKAHDGFLENIKSITLKIDNMMQKNQMKEVVITSTVPAEGKTRLSVNVAFALAKRGKRVLLMDGDFRKPTVHNHFILPKDLVSLEDVLLREKPIKDALHYIKDDKIFFLGNFVPAKSPSELVVSEEMQSLLTDLKEVFDYIIIDAPPCEMMADVAGYLECADAVVYTVRSDWAAIDRIMHGMREMAEQENKLLGFVLNGMEEAHAVYGYGKYGYGKYGYGKYGYGYGKYRYGKKDGI